MNCLKENIKKLPLAETVIMTGSFVLAYAGLFIIASISEKETPGSLCNVLILLSFFLISVAVSLVSVIAGIGGGVIFTPIMLAFTGIDSIIIRGAGLVVAMFSGLVSTGVFIKKGLGNYKLSLIMIISQGAGALFGGILALNIADSCGNRGEGFLRLILGVILVSLAVYFCLGGKKAEWPIVKKIDRITAYFKLGMSYYEESEKRVKHYEVKNLPAGAVLMFLVGVIGGFFGMGGGWAMTPVLNLGMGMPLKLAAANSCIIHGVGGCVSIWPYIFAGSVIPLLILPLFSGFVIGGFMGSHILAKIKVDIVRTILIGIMFITSFGLITKALVILGLIKPINPMATIFIFALIMASVIFILIKRGKSAENRISCKTEEKSSLIKEEACSDDVPIPLSHIVYSNIIHWVIILSAVAGSFVPLFILLNPNSNMLDPKTLFDSVFSGMSLSEIWGHSYLGTFPGAHSYLHYPSFADSWGCFFINVGAGAALWAMIPAVIIQFFKEKSYFTGILGLIFACGIILAMTGFIKA